MSFPERLLTPPALVAPVHPSLMIDASASVVDRTFNTPQLTVFGDCSLKGELVGSCGESLVQGCLSYSTNLSYLEDMPLHQNEYPDVVRIWDQRPSVQRYFLMAVISVIDR